MSGREGPPHLLTIAGSDSGGGAGIQADLKTFAAHGVYGASVITAITAQNTRVVTEVEMATPEVIAAQIDAVFADIRIDGVKIGMVGGKAAIDVIANRLAAHPGIPIVLDPVLAAESGADLLSPDALTELRDRLLPLATLVTPNAPEAERLTKIPVRDEEGQARAARFLAEGRVAVLVKGGHLDGDEMVDLLCTDGVLHRFVHRRITTSLTHGTGCALSSAIAARLALGEPLVEAVGGAIEFLGGAIEAAYPVGAGSAPVNPLYRLLPR